MSPERPDQDDFLEDEEQEEYEGQRSIFATGWFRAVLVLLVLAVIAVIAVPLIGGWFEPTPPTKVTTTKPGEPPSTSAPVPSPPPTPVPATPPKMDAPATPPPTAEAPSTPTPGTGQPAPSRPPATSPATPPATAPPAATSPAPARPETPATAPSKGRTATVPPGKSATKPAAAGNGKYWVQVGAFKDSRNAEGLAQKLRSEGFTVQVSQVARDEPMHVVRVGGYPDRSKASAARVELQGKGQTGFVTSGPAK